MNDLDLMDALAAHHGAIVWHTVVGVIENRVYLPWNAAHALPDQETRDQIKRLRDCGALESDFAIGPYTLRPERIA